VEDKSIPCEDELAYIQSREEHDAVKDRAHFEKQTFFDLGDEAFKVLDTGRIDWLVERFNGTKEEPNNEYILRSDVMSIGGYDWRIKFFPRGNNTDFLSIYIENVTMQAADYEEFEDLPNPAFPLLEGYDYDDLKMRRRRSVAAQVSIVVYNPREPRTHEFKTDAHQYSKQSADYGWRYFSHREEFPYRRHGQREALLRDDKLAFSAYIRVVEDPTGCMWQHGEDGSYANVVLSTGLRPFSGQTPAFAAVLPLLHLTPFREFLIRYREATRMVYRLQQTLYKMFTRTRSSFYGGRRIDCEAADAVTWLRKISRQLQEEVAEPEAVKSLIGDFEGEKAAVRSNRLPVKTCQSIQQGVTNLERTNRLDTPLMLTVELQRQDFDRKKRKWNKLTNKVEVQDTISVANKTYHLYAFVTHCGNLSSNKHNAYIKAGSDSLWYAYEDCNVRVLTRKQAVTAHEGVERSEEKRVDSPFSEYHRRPRGVANDGQEVIYAVMYVREDKIAEVFEQSRVQGWEVPQAVRERRRWKEAMGKETEAEQKTANGPEENAGDATIREKQAGSGAENAIEEGAGTPDWPLTDEEGDVVMFDEVADITSEHAEDTREDEDGPELDINPLAASTTLMNIPITSPSPTGTSQPREVTFDCLGRDYYSGTTLSATYHGQGHLITQSGDEYTGSFHHGQRQGHGTATYSNTGNTYTGSFHANEHHGHGTLTELSTGNVYEGGFKDGKKHGSFVLKGTVTEEDRGLCTICYMGELNTAFYDCGHVVACKECASRIDQCPVCRRRVVGRLQIFGVKMVME